MKDLQVKYTDPLDLIPYENNPRINDYAVKKVMESIKEYGFTNPIIVDADMVIIAGHTRREASILAGLDRVPYIVRDDLTPEQVNYLGSSELKNINVYEDDPIFQIVYFAKRNEANQVVAEKLYEVKEELKRLFLLKRVVPVIPLAGVKEKPRYAKIENYSDDVRVSEGALYVKITLNFTEDVPVEDNYELIGDVDIETKTVTNG